MGLNNCPNQQIMFPKWIPFISLNRGLFRENSTWEIAGWVYCAAGTNFLTGNKIPGSGLFETLEHHYQERRNNTLTGRRQSVAKLKKVNNVYTG